MIFASLKGAVITPIELIVLSLDMKLEFDRILKLVKGLPILRRFSSPETFPEFLEGFLDHYLILNIILNPYPRLYDKVIS